MEILQEPPSNRNLNLGHQRKFNFHYFTTRIHNIPYYEYCKCEISHTLYLFFRDRSFSKGMDTSEETSDTCVDDHHDVSSGPPSGPMDYFAAAAGIFKKFEIQFKNMIFRETCNCQ